MTTTVLDHVELALSGATTITDSRTLSGLIVPFGVMAERNHTGRPVQFLAGSILRPDDLSRVKLLLDHDPTRPLGHCVALVETPAGYEATFHVPPSPEGDAAMRSAADHVRDGLSVGIDVRVGHLSETGDRYIVASCTLDEVSLCSLPAFEGARVHHVQFSLPRKEKTMTDHTTTEAQDQAPDQAADHQAADHQGADHQGTDHQVVTEDQVTEDHHQVTEDDAPAPGDRAVPRPYAPSTFSASRPPTQGRPRLSLAQVSQKVAQLASGGASAGQIQLALSDVLTGDDTGRGWGLLSEQLIGELFTAQRDQRPYIDAITTDTLPAGLKVRGWRWKSRPQVGDYAGDKKEVPSNKVATEPVEASIERTAGAWDVDRIYVDLADGQMIEALIRGAIVDYRAKTDAKVAAALRAPANSTDIGAQDTLAAALGQLGVRAATIGANVSFVALSPQLWTQFLALNRDQVPWWLGAGDSVSLGSTTASIAANRLFVDASLEARQFVAGDRRAATFYEKRPPVQVRAIDLPRGGVDVGVFGYHATLVSDPRALWRGTVTAPATAPATPPVTS